MSDDWMAAIGVSFIVCWIQDCNNPASILVARHGYENALAGVASQDGQGREEG